MVKKGCLTRFWNESEKEAPQDETAKLTNQRKIDGKGLAIVADAHGLLRQQHESVAEVVEPCAVGDGRRELRADWVADHQLVMLVEVDADVHGTLAVDGVVDRGVLD